MRKLPWKCSGCLKPAMMPAVRDYPVELAYDGRELRYCVPALDIMLCGECGTIVLLDEAESRITAGLHEAAGILTPAQIRQQREALGLLPRQLAEMLDVPEATLTRWEEGGQLQTRAQDKLLRLVFDVPQCREYLGAKVAAPPAPALAS